MSDEVVLERMSITFDTDTNCINLAQLPRYLRHAFLGLHMLDGRSNHDTELEERTETTLEGLSNYWSVQSSTQSEPQPNAIAASPSIGSSSATRPDSQDRVSRHVSTEKEKSWPDNRLPQDLTASSLDNAATIRSGDDILRQNPFLAATTATIDNGQRVQLPNETSDGCLKSSEPRSIPSLRPYRDDNEHLPDSQQRPRPVTSTTSTVNILDIAAIHRLKSCRQQHAYLLLLRHHVTQRIIKDGLAPTLLLQRARVHECLGYDDLAVADAYVAFTVVEGEEEDLEAVWLEEDEESEKHNVRGRCLRILERGCERLGAHEDAKRWEGLSQNSEREDGSEDESWTIFDGSVVNQEATAEDVYSEGRSGYSRREIYPWNEHEPDRMSDDNLREINQKMKEVSDCVVVRKSFLPSLAATSDQSVAATNDIPRTSPPEQSSKDNAQLGLFALSDLRPGQVILRELSLLTAIRPHASSLCDACASDISSHQLPDRHCCPGCDIPFCSLQCRDLALSTYHKPNINDEENEHGYPPEFTPFCPGQSGDGSVHELGRAESSETPEEDLYFLLLVRVIMIAETLDVHPLDLAETKWLWGDFNPSPGFSTSASTSASSATDEGDISSPLKLPKKTLPWSLHHNIALPLQLFTTLLLSVPSLAPFTAKWLERYDWWVLQTLLAKFRGVADANLSLWDGKPESASVCWRWCLANHSCNPTCEWEGGGRRDMWVRDERVWMKNDEDGKQGEGVWEGIKKGEEVWSHYTDVRERDVGVRRGRLLEVLGGECLCERCVVESAEVEKAEEEGRR